MATGRKSAVQQITMAERRIQALQLRKAGASYRAIAEALGCDVATAHSDVKAAQTELAAEMRAEAEELRALELARLDDLALAATRILQTTHPLVSGGKVLSGFTADGKAIGLTDAGPKLAAIDRLLRISESRRKLLGLDLQPDALPPGNVAIILRWHDDNRNSIDVTPPTDQHNLAAAPSLPEPDSAEPGALPYRVLWATMGQEPAGGDADTENGA